MIILCKRETDVGKYICWQLRVAVIFCLESVQIFNTFNWFCLYYRHLVIQQNICFIFPIAHRKIRLRTITDYHLAAYK